MRTCAFQALLPVFLSIYWVQVYEMLDEVLEGHRLPTFADFGSLPYIDAIVKESLRWNPVVPLGVSNETSHLIFRH